MSSQAVITITEADGMIEICIEGDGLALDIAEQIFDSEEGGTA